MQFAPLLKKPSNMTQACGTFQHPSAHSFSFPLVLLFWCITCSLCGLSCSKNLFQQICSINLTVCYKFSTKPQSKSSALRLFSGFLQLVWLKSQQALQSKWLCRLFALSPLSRRKYVVCKLHKKQMTNDSGWQL